MKKIILYLIAITLYLVVGINPAKFLYNAYNTHPEERNLTERVVTLSSLSFSEEKKEIDVMRFEERGEVVAFEDNNFLSKLTYVILWVPLYALIMLPYFLTGLLYLKWVILSVVVIAMYSNFGYWLGGYVYEKSINEPNPLTRFLEIPEGFPFNWEAAFKNGVPMKGSIEIFYAFFWPLFFATAFVCWIAFFVYKFIEFICKTIKGIFWLITAGPARERSNKKQIENY